MTDTHDGAPPAPPPSNRSGGKPDRAKVLFLLTPLLVMALLLGGAYTQIIGPRRAAAHDVRALHDAARLNQTQGDLLAAMVRLPLAGDSLVIAGESFGRGNKPALGWSSLLIVHDGTNWRVQLRSAQFAEKFFDSRETCAAFLAAEGSKLHAISQVDCQVDSGLFYRRGFALTFGPDGRLKAVSPIGSGNLH